MLLHPGGEVGADPTPPVVGIDGGVPPVATRELGVTDQPVPVEDPDRAGADVIAGTLPIADDVGLLDDDFADVSQLPGGHDGGNRRLVATSEGAMVRPGGSFTGRIEAERSVSHGRIGPGIIRCGGRNLGRALLFLSLVERMFVGMDLNLLTQDQKERVVVDAEAEIARLRGVQLDVLEDLDRCQVATADGCRSLSEWTTARLDLHPDTAKTLVRTMRRTVDRPDLREALAAGEISFDRLEALSRIPEDVGILEHLDVAGVRREAAKRARISSEDEYRTASETSS